MVGDAGGDPAAGRDRVQVPVAVVIADEGDRRAVGAEPRELLLAGRAGQRRGQAAVAGHEPEIVGVDEDDVRLAHVRIPEHAGVGLDVGGGDEVCSLAQAAITTRAASRKAGNLTITPF